MLVFFLRQKTAYEMRISDWSSVVCSSDLFLNGSLAMEFWPALEQPTLQQSKLDWDFAVGHAPEGKTPVGTYGGWNLAIYDSSEHKIGRASGRERVCQEV